MWKSLLSLQKLMTNSRLSKGETAHLSVVLPVFLLLRLEDISHVSADVRGWSAVRLDVLGLQGRQAAVAVVWAGQ